MSIVQFVKEVYNKKQHYAPKRSRPHDVSNLQLSNVISKLLLPHLKKTKRRTKRQFNLLGPHTFWPCIGVGIGNMSNILVTLGNEIQSHS